MQERYILEEECGGGVVNCESSGEYTLPDYMPEVRRVLRLDADACVTGQFESGGKVEVGGETRYCLLYTDTEGHIASAPLEGNFEAVVGVESGTPLMVSADVENTSCRLGGPRRVSLKTGVTLSPRAYRRVELGEVQVEGEVGETEMLRHSMRTATTAYFHMSDVMCADSVKCDAGTSLLSCDAKALIREVKCEDGGVRVRGEVWTSALCNNESMVPYVIQTKIPLDEMIPCDEVTPDFTGVARAECQNISCEIATDEDGCRAMMDITLTIDGMAAVNNEIRVVTDLYAMDYEVKPHTKHVTGRYYPVMQMANFTIDGGVAKEEIGCDDTPHPVHARAAATQVSCTAEGASVVVSGELRGNCILSCDKADGGYRSEGFHIPFRVRMNCAEAVPYGTDLACDVQCISCRARGDSNRLSVDAEIGIMLVGCGYDTTDVVEDAKMDADAPIMREEGEVIAAYLHDGDSLWSIGRRYHVPLADIIRANSLPEEAVHEADFAHHLDGLTRLIID